MIAITFQPGALYRDETWPWNLWQNDSLGRCDEGSADMAQSSSQVCSVTNVILAVALECQVNPGRSAWRRSMEQKVVLMSLLGGAVLSAVLGDWKKAGSLLDLACLDLG